MNTHLIATMATGTVTTLGGMVAMIDWTAVFAAPAVVAVVSVVVCAALAALSDVVAKVVYTVDTIRGK